jgi:BioD-like phosphotransacetylase family protein
VVDFYLKKDEFERAEKLINSKKKKDLTEEDITNYNDAVKEYNEAAKKMNLLSKKMNEEREKYFKIWNSSVDNFFEKHT